jgi:hypothetical protein
MGCRAATLSVNPFLVNISADEWLLVMDGTMPDEGLSIPCRIVEMRNLF